jgi:hypothetical protein
LSRASGRERSVESIESSFLGGYVGQLARIVILALIIACPVFTLLFALGLGLGTQLVATLAISLATAWLIVTFTGKPS